MLSKKVNIVLGERNFAVLMLAIGVLKDRFDKYAVPRYVTIKGKDLSYSVMIGFDTLRTNNYFDHHHYSVIITLSISPESPYQLDGEVRIKAVETPLNFRFNRPEGLVFFYRDGVCTIPAETQKTIDEFYARIRDHLPFDSDYYR